MSLLQKHSPTLNTVLMVEETLKNADKQLTIAELKNQLPRKVMHSTLLKILDYLQLSGKVLFTSKGIVWIYEDRSKLEEFIRKGLEV
ncbi:MAG: hypothetical protein HY512_02460 [Candidatus Aenigmarchaeota archaeon]|nr:hypothetical protein [Candidatus Aenigmarchaeota archaeon]